VENPTSSLKHPLTGTVHFDEFMVGGPEQQKRGRSKGVKKLIVVALEINKSGVGRAYAEVIEKAASKEVGNFLLMHVSKKSKVMSDEWTCYIPLKAEFKRLEQVASDNGKNFKDIHIYIMNVKSWLRGIHHHCTEERMQGYLNEFHFRFNRRQNIGSIFELLLKRMMNKSPIRLISSNYNCYLNAYTY